MTLRQFILFLNVIYRIVTRTSMKVFLFTNLGKVDYWCYMLSVDFIRRSLTLVVKVYYRLNFKIDQRPKQNQPRSKIQRDTKLWFTDTTFQNKTKFESFNSVLYVSIHIFRSHLLNYLQTYTYTDTSMVGPVQYLIKVVGSFQ